MWWKTISMRIIEILMEKYDFGQYMREKWGDENYEWRFLLDIEMERECAVVWDQLFFSGIEPAWTCQDCRSFWEDSEEEFGQVYSYETGCYKNPAFGNLKTFPFLKAPAKCFCLDFWKSHYPNFIDGTDESYQDALSRYEAFVNRKYPVQSGDAEQLEDDLAADAAGVTLDPEADY